MSDGNLLFVGDTAPNDDLVIASYTPEGQLDPRFGDGQGYVTYDFGDNERVTDVAVDSDGKIILLHQAGVINYLTRLHPNGRLDNGQGRAFSNVTSRNDALRDVVIQPDGKIVVTGYTTNPQNEPRLIVGRYTSTGRLDTSFGGNGGYNGVIDDLLSYSQGRAVALDAQGNILVAGFRRFSSDSNFNFTLRRYDPMGNRIGFPVNNHGVSADFGGNDVPRDMVVQPDGKIIVAGATGGVNPPANFALVRYLESGAPDPDFGQGGKVITDLDGQDSIDFLNAVALLPDGKLLAAGSTRPKGATTGTSVLVRYLADGALDPTFGGEDGIAPVEVSSALAVLPDGKIVVGGHIKIAGRRQFVAARYTAAGEPDSTFNSSGTAVADFGVDATFRGLILEPDGAIVMVGCTQETIDQFAIARFGPEGFLDTSFSDNGRATFDMNSVENACAQALARVASSGDYILTGASDAAFLDGQFALAKVRGRGFVNAPPLAQPDSYTAQAGTPLIVNAPGLLENDQDPDGTALSAFLDSNADHGELVLIADGSFIYTSAADFIGTDNFTYRADDGRDKSDPVSVTIQVSTPASTPTPTTTPDPNPGGNFRIFLPLVVK